MPGRRRPRPRSPRILDCSSLRRRWRRRRGPLRACGDQLAALQVVDVGWAGRRPTRSPLTARWPPRPAGTRREQYVIRCSALVLDGGGDPDGGHRPRLPARHRHAARRWREPDPVRAGAARRDIRGGACAWTRRRVPARSSSSASRWTPHRHLGKGVHVTDGRRPRDGRLHLQNPSHAGATLRRPRGRVGTRRRAGTASGCCLINPSGGTSIT